MDTVQLRDPGEDALKEVDHGKRRGLRGCRSTPPRRPERASTTGRRTTSAQQDVGQSSTLATAPMLAFIDNALGDGRSRRPRSIPWSAAQSNDRERRDDVQLGLSDPNALR